MRHHSLTAAPTAEAAPSVPKSEWGALRKLAPYLWQWRWRVLLALSFLVAAKVANVGVPLLLKNLVDAMSIKPGDAAALLVVPVGLIVAYGALRLSTSLFTELRELIFAKATEGTARSISLEVFRHLHALSLRFHLERQTGGMTRDIERGTRAVHSLISYSLYSILPTLIEVTLVLALLAIKFDAWFAGITIIALVVYIAFTITVTGVNDAPSFTAVDPATVLEDAGPQTVSGWASFNAGPGEGSQAVQAYTVSAVSNAALFSVPPSVNAPAAA